MPDLSLFEPLCTELGITINELLSGEKINQEQYQEELEKNIVNTIDYSQKQIEGQKQKISFIIMIVGIFISLSAFIIFSPESSWSSIYSVFGILVFVIGLFKELKIKSKIKKVGISLLTFIVIFSIFYITDFISVISFHRPPMYRYTTTTEWKESKIITYNSLFYRCI